MNLTKQGVHQKGQERQREKYARKPPPDDTNFDLINLVRQKGTDKEFRAWVNLQASCLTGKFSERVDGVWKNPACHVRRGGASGTGYKAPYACVAMTHEEHATQSNLGEKACLERYVGGSWTVEEAKAWFDDRRIATLTGWISANP